MCGSAWNVYQHVTIWPVNNFCSSERLFWWNQSTFRMWHKLAMLFMRNYHLSLAWCVNYWQVADHQWLLCLGWCVLYFLEQVCVCLKQVWPISPVLPPSSECSWISDKCQIWILKSRSFVRTLWMGSKRMPDYPTIVCLSKWLHSSSPSDSCLHYAHCFHCMLLVCIKLF